MTDTRTDTDLIACYADTFTHDLTADDLANGGIAGTDLYELAERMIRTQADAPDPWLRDLARKKPQGGLTNRQAAGVLNCLFRPPQEPAFHAGLGFRIGDTFIPPARTPKPARDGDDEAYEAWLVSRTRSLSAGAYGCLTLGPWRPNSAFGAGAMNRRIDLYGTTIGYQRDTGALDALPLAPRAALASFYQVLADERTGQVDTFDALFAPLAKAGRWIIGTRRQRLTAAQDQSQAVRYEPLPYPTALACPLAR